MVTLQGVLKANSDDIKIPEGMQERLLQKILNWIETMSKKSNAYKKKE